MLRAALPRTSARAMRMPTTPCTHARLTHVRDAVHAHAHAAGDPDTPSETARRGANMSLDPRGVDYALFEDPSAEYVADVPAVLDERAGALSAATALLHRLLSSAHYNEALRALDQLQALHTPVAPLCEAFLGARWCVAHGDAAAAVRWLALCPRQDALGAAPRRWEHQADQVVQWLARRTADAGTGAGACAGAETDALDAAAALQEACVTLARLGYGGAVSIGVAALYRTGAWPMGTTPTLFWARLAAESTPSTALLSRLYNRAVRALVAGRHWDEASAWVTRGLRARAHIDSGADARTVPLTPCAPSTSAGGSEAALTTFTAHFFLTAWRRCRPAENSAAAAAATMLLRHMPAAARSDAFARDARDARSAALAAHVDACVARGDMSAALVALVDGARARTLPRLETLATFLCGAARLRRMRTRGGASRATGEQLARLRRALASAPRRQPPAFWETALLRAREKDDDPQGVLRVWRARFLPPPGVEEAAMAVEEAAAGLAAAPPQSPSRPPPARSYAAAVETNSARRPVHTRDLRMRCAASAYAAGIAVRALVAQCGGDGARVRRAYAHFAQGVVRAHEAGAGGASASAPCFDAFLPALSIAAPSAFVRASSEHLTVWSVLHTMRQVGVAPGPRTWTFVLQALARDGSHGSWERVCALLRGMSPGRAAGSRERRGPHGVPMEHTHAWDSSPGGPRDPRARPAPAAARDMRGRDAGSPALAADPALHDKGAEGGAEDAAPLCLPSAPLALYVGVLQVLVPTGQLLLRAQRRDWLRARQVCNLLSDAGFSGDDVGGHVPLQEILARIEG
ncbi:hypothetical protein MSPP1_002540 [Malassezia sp. CBS 17886]|nr:hypothetical protein MSPP1_002540 [Malassezia sp. CBS 17886]